MCGITGYVDWHLHDPGAADHRDQISAMVATLIPRGPDGHGISVHRHAALGHTRLAIIDLAGGQQPMTTRGAGGLQVALTYSGEIYNHRSLRRELEGRGHHFTTRSDTEVLLRAYVEWGAACVDRLRGIFAFAIWDEGTQELLLVRDRMGVKPLYYAELTAGIAFGSEIEALLRHPGVFPEVDDQGVAELFCMVPNYTPGLTPFRAIQELQPGHLLRYGRDGLHLRRYWALQSRPHEHDLAQTATHVRELLDQAVHEQLQADVPVAALNSGGLDSSAVAALAARRRTGSLATFTIDYAGASDQAHASSTFHRDRDTPHALTVAAQIGSRHITHEVSTQDLLEVHHRGVHAMDLPSLPCINASLLLLFQRIKQEGYPVVLSGESADELFGGYAFHQSPQEQQYQGFPWQLRTYLPMHQLLSAETIARIRPQAYLQNRYRQAVAHTPRLAGEVGLQRRMREVSHLTITHYLSFLLRRKDRTSMTAGVEARVPFCDHRLVEYAWNIPWQMQQALGMEKGVLRRAVADLLPPSVAWRRKSGYPAAQTPQYQQALWAQLREVLRNPSSPLLQMVDPQRITTMLDRHDRDLSDWTTMLRAGYLLEVDTWMREHHIKLV
ncbi:asparagine synthase (glutamine-hydrolyzing) [Actinoplanes oblitus]|uniref:asparagine synthase (glutamine-hydrolyzing) n=1 Tax=Actinoplanes oblitus TaxID=3040509 RepID=A0ABY8WQB2_9ACTN|nr:asparagine synthase (glutamine-hydrolyzing) [Actinoplanes oblitus]WIN00092.1 asparagine synthase (glutamine-hydrolyzing) [Actinoplanes oblitus]